MRKSTWRRSLRLVYRSAKSLLTVPIMHDASLYASVLALLVSDPLRSLHTA